MRFQCLSLEEYLASANNTRHSEIEHDDTRGTIRELRLGPEKIRIGNPLRNFHGVLTVPPTFLGETKED